MPNYRINAPVQLDYANGMQMDYGDIVVERADQIPDAAKVVYFGETLVDLTEDTVAPNVVKKGYTFHASNGERLMGTMSGGGGDDPDLEIKVLDVDPIMPITTNAQADTSQATSYPYNHYPYYRYNNKITSYDVIKVYKEQYGYIQNVYNYMGSNFKPFEMSMGMHIRDINCRGMFAWYQKHNLQEMADPFKNENGIYFSLNNVKDASFMFASTFINSNSGLKYPLLYNSYNYYINLNCNTLLSTAYMFYNTNFVSASEYLSRTKLEISDTVENMAHMFDGVFVNSNKSNINDIIKFKFPNNVKNISGSFANILTTNQFVTPFLPNELPESVIDASYLYYSSYYFLNYITNYNNLEIKFHDNILSTAFMFASSGGFNLDKLKSFNYPNYVQNISGMFAGMNFYRANFDRYQLLNFPETVTDASYLLANGINFFNTDNISIEKNNCNLYSAFAFSSFAQYISNFSIIGNNLNCDFLFGWGAQNYYNSTPMTYKRIYNTYIIGNNISCRYMYKSGGHTNYNVYVEGNNIDLSYLFAATNTTTEAYKLKNVKLNINCKDGLNLHNLFHNSTMGSANPNNFNLIMNYENINNMDFSQLLYPYEMPLNTYMSGVGTNIFGNNLNFYLSGLLHYGDLNVVGNDINLIQPFNMYYPNSSFINTSYNFIGNNISCNELIPGQAPFNININVFGNDINISNIFGTGPLAMNCNHNYYNINLQGTNISACNLFRQNLNTVVINFRANGDGLNLYNALNIYNTSLDTSRPSYIEIAGKNNMNLVNACSGSYYGHPNGMCFINLFNNFNNMTGLSNINLRGFFGYDATIKYFDHLNIQDMNISGNNLDIVQLFKYANFNSLKNINISGDSINILDIFNTMYQRNLYNININVNNSNIQEIIYITGTTFNDANFNINIDNSYMYVLLGGKPNSVNINISGNNDTFGGILRYMNNSHIRINANDSIFNSCFYTLSTLGSKYSNINITGNNLNLYNSFPSIYRNHIPDIYLNVTNSNMVNMFYNWNTSSSTFIVNMYVKNASNCNKAGMFYMKHSSLSVYIYCNNVNEFTDYNLTYPSIGSMTWTAMTNGYYNAAYSIYVYNNYNPND